MRHRLATGAVAVLLIADSAAAQRDINGTWAVTATFPGIGPRTATYDITQTGTTLSTPDGGSGTIDVETGVFTLSYGPCRDRLEGSITAESVFLQGVAYVAFPDPSCGTTHATFTGVRATCGNGTLDAGEQCEPPVGPCCFLCRFAAAGSACGPYDDECTRGVCGDGGVCTHSALPADTPCDSDGQACTSDRCDGAGTCAHVVVPAGTPCEPAGPCKGTCDGVDPACAIPDVGTYDARCPACYACDGLGACAPRARAACSQVTRPGASTLRVLRRPGGNGDRLGWTWSKGDATTLADFGDPAQNGIAVCAWTAGHDLLTATVPGGKGWKATRKRIRYERATGVHGITAMTLVPGAALESRIRVAGRGPALGLPLTTSMALPIVMQLQQADRCWEATFSAASHNTRTRLDATSD